MKSLLVYLKRYVKESFCAPLFKLLEASFELIVPLVIAAIIDKGIANGNKTYILSRCGILVLLAIVGMVAAITAQYFAAKAATGFGRGLRSALYQKIQTLSFNELDNLGTSSLILFKTVLILCYVFYFVRHSLFSGLWLWHFLLMQNVH